MNILTRYLIGRFLKILFFSLVASVLVFLVIDVIENLDKFLDKNVSPKIIFTYYYLYTPFIAFLVFPVAVILATLITIGGMMNSREIVAMRASGISLWWISNRLMLMGGITSVLLFYFGEYVLPRLNQQRLEIWRVEVRKLPKRSTVRSDRIYLLESPNTFFHMERWDDVRKVGYRPTIQKAESNSLTLRIDAEQAIWDTSQNKWKFYRGVERVWNNGNEFTERFAERVIDEIHLTPIDFVDLSLKPEEMGYEDLKQFIEKLKSTGSDATRWEVDLWSKLASPASTAIIIFIALPIAAVQRRSGMILSFGIGLLVSFLYFGVMQIAKIFGYQGDLPAPMAAWFANGLFFLMGWILLIRVRK
ncbi:MAG: LPS export ABC transporter permease LptG [bacterium]|nr:LPS export ABC transporter permease LptG [bacterium]